MTRSLGLVILVVLPIWLLARAPASDEVELREVDPSGPIAAFAADVPAAPVPGSLPADWRATSATYDGAQQTVRVGWVTPSQQYAEYAASTAPRDDVLRLVVGADVEQLESLTVGGEPWEQYRDSDGSLSLTRSYGSATVVVGTKRASVTLSELEVLLRSLTTR